MRISDWNSDVCSSDLNACKALPSDLLVSVVTNGTAMLRNWPQSLKNWSQDEFDRLAPDYSAIRKSRHTIKVMARDNVLHPQQKQFFQMAQLGRASCRERVCLYV